MLEVFGGLAILLGFFTRPVAFVLAGEMAYAFWFMHVPMMGRAAIIPVTNGGDGAVLFCFSLPLPASLPAPAPGASTKRSSPAAAASPPPEPARRNNKAASRAAFSLLQMSRRDRRRVAAYAARCGEPAVARGRHLVLHLGLGVIALVGDIVDGVAYLVHQRAREPRHRAPVRVAALVGLEEHQQHFADDAQHDQPEARR